MHRSILSIAACCFLAAGLFAFAGEPRAIPELAPRKATFSANQLPLNDVLSALAKQTGNPITDRRSKRDNPQVKLPAGPTTFWQALDTMGLGFSTYQPDGGVALVDAPYSKLRTHYSGMFRFTVKRIVVSRDEATQGHQCNVTLDVAWEPRLAPLYLSVERGEVGFAKQSEKLDRQALTSVSGSCAREIDLRMKAPSRAVMALDSLKGELRVIGAPKMLDFQFLNPAKGSSAELEGVKLRVTEVKRTATLWTVGLTIENPDDARKHLETHQSWLDNNRIWLAWGTHRLEADPNADKVDGDTGKTAKLRYEFVPQSKTPLPPPNAAVTLHYWTPNRVLSFAVPFEFRDLPLP